METIKGYYEIRRTPESERTPEEQKRFELASSIPESARNALEEKATEIYKQVMELEKERDIILDFLNGFWEGSLE